MESKGYWRVTGLFRKHMKNTLLFAYKKLEGISIPWHNNWMERLMVEIAKRMKNKWMKWSDRGAENLGNLLMKMRFEKDVYESFIAEVMKVDRNIRWGVNLHHDEMRPIFWDYTAYSIIRSSLPDSQTDK